MLGNTIVDATKNQIKEELIASTIYLEMSKWTSNQNLMGCTKFLQKQSQEELDHMQYAVDYLENNNIVVEIPSIYSLIIPDLKILNILDLFEKSLIHEKYVTSVVKNFISIATRENDNKTLKMLEWFTEEQHQEEEMFEMIIADIIDIGLDNLLIIDNALDGMR